jgi:hypothetical protein
MKRLLELFKKTTGQDAHEPCKPSDEYPYNEAPTQRYTEWLGGQIVLSPEPDEEVTIKSQNALIRAHLESGQTISPILALHLFGCARLAARIHDLRGQGLEILTKKPKKGKQYAIYELLKKQDEKESTAAN